MRVLLSTIGSRGDVQPLVGLALQLKAFGHEARLCVPPDFRAWIEGLGFAVTPIGPELQKLTAAKPGAGWTPPTPEQRRQMVEGTLAAQFESVTAAAQGCEVIVAATALQIAARSVAEHLGIQYFFVAYCPNVLPSPHHAPPVLGMLGQKPATAADDLRALWAADAQRSNDTWGALLNARRAGLGLAPVEDVRSHIFTDQPWLAADPTLSPWPGGDAPVFQTGAWLVADERPLAPELEAFLDDGEPPIYFGFGSIRAPEGLARVMLQSARALGRRAIVSRGWADLTADDAADCIAIGEVNQQALFKRVAAVVHHGGAGTTTAAALGGAAQVVIPQMYDQHFWAGRVHALGIGVAHAPGAPTADSLQAALEQALNTNCTERAREVAKSIRTDGAAVAAQRLSGLQS